MNSGFSGTTGGFRVALPRSLVVLDIFLAPTYASRRGRNGVIEPKPCPQSGGAEKQILILLMK